MIKKLFPIISLVAACGGPISEESWPLSDASFDDEDAGEVGLVSEELLAECSVEAMHKASRKFFLQRAPKNTVCSGKVTDQRWHCTAPGGRTYSVFAYDVTYTQVHRSVQPSQAKSWKYVCDYSASCQLSCRQVLGTVVI